MRSHPSDGRRPRASAPRDSRARHWHRRPRASRPRPRAGGDLRTDIGENMQLLRTVRTFKPINKNSVACYFPSSSCLLLNCFRSAQLRSALLSSTYLPASSYQPLPISPRQELSGSDTFAAGRTLKSTAKSALEKRGAHSTFTLDVLSSHPPLPRRYWLRRASGNTPPDLGVTTSPGRPIVPHGDSFKSFPW